MRRSLGHTCLPILSIYTHTLTNPSHFLEKKRKLLVGLLDYSADIVKALYCLPKTCVCVWNVYVFGVMIVMGVFATFRLIFRK